MIAWILRGYYGLQDQNPYDKEYTRKLQNIYKLLYANDNLKHKMKSNHVLITIDYTIP